MGNMKWIYGMIMDGSYDRFKLLYIKCVLTDSTSFNFNGHTYVKSFARSVVKYVDENNLIAEYDKNIDSVADAEYDSQFLEQ
tara:strand:- start:171 stop:416 length:246 start_codon:yes stop_codon:yes gene_type:complete